MCGIIGYIGARPAAEIIINGLKRLEYRGYDSSGIALINNGLFINKKIGKITDLESSIEFDKLRDYITGVGHTRWATHGAPSDINAHPHIDCKNEIALVHNGIIENYVALKKTLISHGHTFQSDTDTEVVAHLIEHYCNRLELMTLHDGRMVIRLLHMGLFVYQFQYIQLALHQDNLYHQSEPSILYLVVQQ